MSQVGQKIKYRINIIQWDKMFTKVSLNNENQLTRAITMAHIPYLNLFRILQQNGKQFFKISKKDFRAQIMITKRPHIPNLKSLYHAIWYTDSFVINKGYMWPFTTNGSISRIWRLTVRGLVRLNVKVDLKILFH